MLPPRTDADQVVTFFRSWFGYEPERFISLVSMPANGRKFQRNLPVEPETAIATFGAHGLDELVYQHDKQWNLYFSVGLAEQLPKPPRRGGKECIIAVPGVWVDLDTDKEGFFSDENECLELLRSLPEEVWPTAVVATGTGGVHAYWKTNRLLGPAEAERLCTLWWTYLSEQTEAKIDRLCNCDRIMKLPGSIRWPKSEHDQPSLVRLVYASDRTIPVDALERLGVEPYARHLESIRRRKEDVKNRRLAAGKAASDLTGWDMLMALVDIEDEFNATYTWQDVLGPLGWTYMGTDSEDRELWARPGLSQWELHKSAATGYEGSHVMSLFSDSQETGLSHLIDTGVTLTKYRVYVETVWKGDEANFIRAYLKDRR